MGAQVPVVVVTGGDDTLRSAAVREVVADALGGDDPSLAVADFGGDDYEVAAVVDAARTPPFLSERRVVVARDVGRFGADELAPLIGYLADPLDTTTLVLVAGGGRLSSRLTKAAKEAGGRTVATDVPTGRGRGEWLTRRLKEAPVTLDAPARELVDRHLGEDLGRLPGLLDVLVAVHGQGARLGPDDVAPLLGEAGSVAPWDLTDAIDAGRTADALEALHRMLGAGGRHPLQLLATLHGHYTAMLRLDGAAVGPDEAADRLGIHPFRARKALEQGRRLGSEGVHRAIRLLAQADLDLKGESGLPPEVVLDVLVARLSQLGRTRGRSRR